MPARGIHHIDLAVRDVERPVSFHLGLLRAARPRRRRAGSQTTAAPRKSCTSVTGTWSNGSVRNDPLRASPLDQLDAVAVWEDAKVECMAKAHRSEASLVRAPEVLDG